MLPVLTSAAAGARRVQAEQQPGADRREAKNQKSTQNQNKPEETYDGSIHLQQVSIGRDYGAATEVLAGFSAGDMIIVNPNDDVSEGAKVQASLTKANLDVGSHSSQQTKMNANSEKLQPEPGAEHQSRQPSKNDKKRGPGY